MAASEREGELHEKEPNKTLESRRKGEEQGRGKIRILFLALIPCEN